MRRAAAAIVALGLGCAPARAPVAPPQRPCAEAWASVPEAQRDYDWARDPVRTARGNEGYARFAERLPRRGCLKTWTVLLYMEADAGDLVGPAARDLRSMEAPSSDPSWSAASTVRADVVVQLHRPDPHETLRLHLFRVPRPAAPPDVASPIVEALDEEQVPTDESLHRFVTWGVERYPAEHYAVIVWGHGEGWRPALPGPPQRVHHDSAAMSGGIAFDERRGTVLDIPGLRRALEGASRERLGGHPFDVYASDACLMQSVEVAGELGGVARYVVGSEQIEEDYLGLPYRVWVPAVNGSAPPRPVAATCPLADLACDAAAAMTAFEGAGSGGTAAGADPAAGLPAGARREGAPSERFTLSAVDTAGLGSELLPALRRLGAAIEDYVREDDLRRIGLQVLLGPARGLARGTPDFRGGARDVGVFLTRLEAAVQREPGAAGSPGQRGVLQAVAVARAVLGRVVVAASFGPYYYRTVDDAGMAGLSVWLPHDEAEYHARIGFFAPAALYLTPAGEPSFRGFLERVFAPPPSQTR